MMSEVGKKRDYRFVVTIVLLVAIAASFWLTSRYPALDQKAQNAADVEIAGALGFDALIDIRPSDPILERIGGTAVNWLWSNRQGMAFGILLGAVLLTSLSLTKGDGPKSSTASTFMGVVIGAPLGVCVNCAAPISHGLRVGGARSETALAAMFSSPTYNVVVVSIALSILPFYMVMLKLGLTLLFIMTAVPYLSRSVPALAAPSETPRGGIFAKWVQSEPSLNLVTLKDDSSDESYRLGASALWVIRSTVRNLWVIGRLAVPLMLLAAIAGAIFVTLLPFGDLVERLPDERMPLIILGLIFISVIGLALPLPIAFDVVVAGSLWASGFPANYVMALYFTLGIYSIYSAFVVGKVFSKKLAWQLAVPLVLVGVVGGLAAEGYASWRVESRIAAAVGQLARTDTPVVVPLAASAFEASGSWLDSMDAASDALGGDDVGLSLFSTPFDAPTASGTSFTTIGGEELGFADRPRIHPSYNHVVPFDHLGGGSAGDINNDGWIDVVVTSDFGVTVYQNLGATFQAVEVAGGALMRGIATNAMLLDVDNDSDLDLVATYMDGANLLVVNSGGGFSRDGVIELPGPVTASTFIASLAAADIDRDGDVDIVSGWYHLSARGEQATNFLWRQDEAGRFVAEPLTGPNGPTLSVLITDLTGDGWPDLLAGNDFVYPDVGYRNDGAGHLVTQTDLIPISTNTTMSYSLGDFDGDTVNDIYIGQITRTDEEPDALQTVKRLEACSRLADPLAETRCHSEHRISAATQEAVIERDLSQCLNLVAIEQESCLAAGLTRVKRVSEEYCDVLPGLYPEFSPRCAFQSLTLVPIEERNRTAAALDNGSVTSQNQANVLLTGSSSFTFSDTASTAGLEYAGWTWDTSPLDIDNDGDLDLSVVNGNVFRTTTSSNMIYLNSGETFVAMSDELGFMNHRATTGSLVLDFDNDGDLDIVTIPVVGAPTIYRNDLATGAAIELDISADFPTAGTTVTLSQADVTIRRDLILGGGYASFDSQRFHFGLGQGTGPVDLTIEWPDGRVSTLTELRAGRRYLLTGSWE